MSKKMRICRKCKNERPLSDYYHGGMDHVCKHCYNKRQVEWSRIHPDSVRKAQKKFQKKMKSVRLKRRGGIPFDRKQHLAEQLKSSDFNTKRLSGLRKSPKAYAHNHSEAVRDNFKKTQKEHPRFQKDENHFLAKEWKLCSPERTIYQFKNLRAFVRDNPELFDPDDVEWRHTKNSAADNCKATAGLSSLSPRRQKPRAEWHGWTFVYD